MTCVKPFTIPDSWIEKQDPGGWDSLNSTFDMVDNQQQARSPNPDIYIGPDRRSRTTPATTPERDRGMELMIRAGTGNNI